MSRSPLIVNEKQLESVINDLESKNTYGSVGDLCQAVSDTDWAKGIQNAAHKVKGISPQMVYVKIREFKIPIKTQRGKRTAGDTTKRVSRGDKIKRLDLAEYQNDMKQELGQKGTPDKAKALAAKAMDGSIKAAVQFKCYQCYGYTEGYKSCTGGDGVPCALYPINRLLFQNRKKPVMNEGFCEFTKSNE